MRLFIFFLVWLSFLILSLSPMIDPDLGWHLVAGKYTLENYKPPQSDLSSFTNPNYPYIYHSWLAEFKLYLIYKHFGLLGVGIFYAAISSIGFIFLYKLSNLKNTSLKGLVFICLSIPMAQILYGNSIRVQAFSFVFLVILEWLINFQLKLPVTDKKIKWFTNKINLSLILLFLLWVNIHGGFILGYLYLGLRYLLYFIFSLELIKLKSHQNKLKNLLIFSLILAIISLINPYGIRLNLFTWQMITNSANSYNHDWSPIFISQSNIELFFKIVLILGSVFLILIKNINKETKTLIAFLLLLSFASARFSLPLFVVIIPLLTNYLVEFSNKIMAQSKFVTILVYIFPILIIGNLIINKTKTNWVSYSSLEATAQYSRRSVGFPYHAVAYLEKHSYQPNLFNDINWGGYLVLVNPETKYFADGKMDNYYINGKSFTFEYLSIINTEPGWHDKLVNYNINTVIIQPNTKLSKKLKESPDWTTTYEDQIAIVFQKGV